jgi:polysaccharide biosynthesis/export protein
MRKLLAIGLLTLLSACASPSDGPSESNILNGRQPNSEEKIPVIDLAQAPLGAMVVQTPSYSADDPGLGKLRSTAYSGSRIRRGDTIEVTIFDTGEEGLFSATNSKTLDLGRFTVDDSGAVNMPFVGKQHVLGSTPEAVQSRIVAGLKGKAVSPQAVVKIVESPTSAVSVSGGVRQSGRLALNGGRQRILDVIAQSGGTTGQPNATIVTLIRGQQRVETPLDRIMADPKQNN